MAPASTETTAHSQTRGHYSFSHRPVTGPDADRSPEALTRPLRVYEALALRTVPLKARYQGTKGRNQGVEYEPPTHHQNLKRIRTDRRKVQEPSKERQAAGEQE